MIPWKPDISQKRGPKYQLIADALLQAIEKGILVPGDSLPPHRTLAEEMGVTVGTVTRAYAEAKRRGYAIGEIGRGTFVSGETAENQSDEKYIDMSLSVPLVPTNSQERTILKEAFAELAFRPDLMNLLANKPHAGQWEHRKAGAQMLQSWGVAVEPDCLLITTGCQHAIAVILSVLTQPGDTILTEAFTYPGVKGVARLRNLRLRGVAMDKDGIIPGEFAKACKVEHPKALYCIPNVQNPTSVTIPQERRLEIAAIAEKYSVAIIEDDVYGFLAADCFPPLIHFAPGVSYYATGISKLIAPGLRIGYIAAPKHMIGQLANVIGNTTWMAPPLMAAVVARWIKEGVIDQFIASKREEAKTRMDIARRILGEYCTERTSCSYHIWLALPDPWNSQDFVLEARRRNVILAPAHVFVTPPHASPERVRISLMPVANHEKLETGLQVIRELLCQSPPSLNIV